MELLLILAKGILMGLAIAAPIGPMALLCIRRTIARGRWLGLISGLGVATADGFYGTVAAFGLSTVSDLLLAQSFYLQILGGLFLCYLGLKTFFDCSDIPSQAVVESASLTPGLTVTGAYTSMFALTLTNPTTIFSFIAIFAGLGITQTQRIASVTLVFGVFTGSMLWWLVLVSGVMYLRNRLTSEKLARFNRVSTRMFGALIFGFGVAALTLS
ncbi:MAG: lysine transporter LysE [Leptolyngbya foveolarum]|uniref:Lysine transporter LysE n=1 Tax=Leptolyngbya foveolarum TaxID=47253 RepID=A0A2W4TIY6_9CYAN|nr:MAG: lysine transporter LysE [Leptolyngbya foveolarum]